MSSQIPHPPLLTASEPPDSIGQRFKQPSFRWLLGLGLLGLLLVAIPVLKAKTAASSEAQEVQTATPLPVDTLDVSEVDAYEVSRAYTGEIAALQASELGFERSGQLTEIRVPEGGTVQAGTPLARLDIRNLQTQRSQIEAEKARALAELSELETGARTEDIAAATAAVQDLEQQIALQRVQLARRKTLYEQGAISQEALDEFSFGEGSLQARLNQSRSQLQELQNGTRPEKLTAQAALIQQLDARIAEVDVTIEKSTLIAPFSGTVAAHKVDTGTVVGAGQSVIRLVESNLPEARIGLPTETVSKLNIGEERTVELNGETFTATLTSILPEVEAQTRTQTVVFALEARAAGKVSPGQTVRLTLANRIARKGIWLPTEALTQGIRGLWTCYVVVPEGDAGQLNQAEQRNQTEQRFVVRPQSVEVIHQEGDRALVTGTLQPGDTIVSSGSHRLVPGQWVSPVASSGDAFVSE
ncbi:MAG: efflux RND transporter periplasmic adaptor subunit [Cyanobacteria bacterium J06634_5]